MRGLNVSNTNRLNQPMKKPLLILGMLTALHVTVSAQSTKSDSTAAKATVQATAQTEQKKAEKEEVVEGIWAVGGYFGKKLADELGNRMNLEESKDPEPQERRKVTLKIGPIKIERYE